MKITHALKNSMQANRDDNYLIQLGFFSHVNLGRKVSDSRETSYLDA